MSATILASPLAKKVMIEKLRQIADALEAGKARLHSSTFARDRITGVEELRLTTMPALGKLLEVAAQQTGTERAPERGEERDLDLSD